MDALEKLMSPHNIEERSYSHLQQSLQHFVEVPSAQVVTHKVLAAAAAMDMAPQWAIPPNKPFVHS